MGMPRAEGAAADGSRSPDQSQVWFGLAGDSKVARIGAKFKGGMVRFPGFAAHPKGARRTPDVRRDHQKSRSLLQLALQRFDLFGQRRVPGHQGLDLAHGMQDRGVVAPAEPASDFR